MKERKCKAVLPLHQLSVPAALGFLLRLAAKLDWKTISLRSNGTAVLYTAPKGFTNRQVIILHPHRGGGLSVCCSVVSGTCQQTNREVIEHIVTTFSTNIHTEKIEKLHSLFEKYALPFQLAVQNTTIIPKTELRTSDRIQRFSGKNLFGGFFIIMFVANLLPFLWGVFSGAGFFEFTSEFLLSAGALYSPYLVNGEYWRFFTSMFLHDGAVHFLYNMLAAVYALLFLKEYFHSWTIIFIYISTGLIASSVSVWYHPDVFAVGASGAIFGLYGAVISLSFFGTIDKSEAGGAAIFIGILTFIGLISGMKEGVDNAAHIGGVLGGLLIGSVLQPVLVYHQSPLMRWLYPVVSIPVAVLIVVIMFADTDKTPARYELAMTQFDTLEDAGMIYYREDIYNGSDSLRISALRDSCLPAWYQAKNLLTAVRLFRGLNYDQSIRIERLQRYTDLRIATSHLLIWYYTDDTRYTAQLSDSLFTELKKTLDKLNGK